MISKQDYIETFIEELEEHNDLHELNLDQICNETIWMNIAIDGGMRLTHFGFKVLKEGIQLDSWEFKIPAYRLQNSIPKNKLLLQLDRHVDGPYYLDTNKRVVHIFNNMTCTMIGMQGIIKFLKNQEKFKNTLDTA